MLGDVPFQPAADAAGGVATSLRIYPVTPVSSEADICSPPTERELAVSGSENSVIVGGVKSEVAPEPGLSSPDGGGSRETLEIVRSLHEVRSDSRKIALDVRVMLLVIFLRYSTNVTPEPFAAHNRTGKKVITSPVFHVLPFCVQMCHL